MRCFRYAAVVLCALGLGACSTFQIAQDISQNKLDELTVPARQDDLRVLRGVYVASAISLYGADAVGRYSGKDSLGDARALAAQIKAVRGGLQDRQKEICPGKKYSEYDYLDYLDHRLVPLIEQSIRPAKRYWSGSLSGFLMGDAIASVKTATEALGRLAEIDLYRDAITLAARREFDEIVKIRVTNTDVAKLVAEACPPPATGPISVPSAVDQISAAGTTRAWFSDMPADLRGRMCAEPAVTLSEGEVRRIRAFLSLRSSGKRSLKEADFIKASQTMVDACNRLSGILQEKDACGLESFTWKEDCSPAP